MLRQPAGGGGAAGTRVPLLLFLHSAAYDPVGELFPEGDGWLDAGWHGPLFVLCPRCPDNYYWLLRGNSWTEEGGEWITDSRGFHSWVAPAAEEMDATLVGLLADMVRRFLVDPKRIFLTGASMGGHACLDLAARHPRLFCAVAPVAAHVQEDHIAWTAKRLRGIPVWAFHGVGDLCCRFDDIEVLIRKIGDSAWLTTYREGH